MSYYYHRRGYQHFDAHALGATGAIIDIFLGQVLQAFSSIGLEEQCHCWLHFQSHTKFIFSRDAGVFGH